MIGRDYTYTFASGVAAPVRPWRHLRAALVALAAVCVFGVSLVTREEVTTPSVRARNAVVMPTPTPIWQLEARWWAGDNRQANVLLAAISSKTELTFAHGYQARLAARQAATTVAAVPSTEIHLSDANKADAVPLPTPRPPRRVAVARTEPPAPSRFDYRTQATLAFGNQPQSPRAFFAQPNNPFSGLFGTGNLY
jgi:hypothetical protein